MARGALARAASEGYIERARGLTAPLPRARPLAIFPGMEWRTSQPRKRLGTVKPCIPTRVSKPPVGPQWVHEIKRDGYRLIARKQGDRVRLFTRRGHD
jgi:ATP-dependent DNA ligase